MRRVEQNAFILRERANVGPTGRLDPMQVSDKLGFVLAQPHEVQTVLGDRYEQFCSLEPTVWSGMAKRLSDGRLFILLNPNQTPERRNVTILEEVAHIHYGHQPARFNSFMQREYDEASEEEAYQTAAAALLPMKVIAQAVWRNRSAPSIAGEYGTSVELVEMRIKRLGLWSEYKSCPS
jgi:hypothetical protein